MPKRERFVQRYLDPASRLGEILFGLIMVLTITLSAGLTVEDGKEGVRQLLIAAIGCNLAWGIIDAVMYLMNCLTVRHGKVRLVQFTTDSADSEAVLEMVRSEIEPDLQAMLLDEDAAAFRQDVLKHIVRARTTKPGLTSEDFYGAIACFWLVFISCLPAALPFLIFSSPHLALRVSNALLLILLFLVGQKWAQYAGTNRFATGAVMVAIGLILVIIAIALGG